MDNRHLTRGTLVTLDGEPYVVIRPDSDRMVELYPGDELPAPLKANLRRWVWSCTVQPRQEAEAPVDATLEAIVAVLRNQAEYITVAHGVDSPEWNTVMATGFLLADKLHGEGTPERKALLRRMFADL